jgi:hypothetical protein
VYLLHARSRATVFGLTHDELVLVAIVFIEMKPSPSSFVDMGTEKREFLATFITVSERSSLCSNSSSLR